MRKIHERNLDQVSGGTPPGQFDIPYEIDFVGGGSGSGGTSEPDGADGTCDNPEDQAPGC